MNAVTLLNVIGATHFIVGESEDDGEELEDGEEGRSEDDVSDGSYES